MLNIALKAKQKFSKKSEKILFVLPNAHCGGAENVLITLLKYIPRDLFQPFLLLADKNGPLLKEIPDDVTLISLNRKRLSRSIIGIIKSVWEIRPDVILSSLFHINIAVIFLKYVFPKKTRVIIRESNLPSIQLKREKHPFLFELLVKLAYRHADAVICLGNQMKENLIEYFKVPKNLINIIPNPIDLGYLKRLSKQSVNPYDNSKYNFLAVGSLTPQKGFDILIEAMGIIEANLRSKIHLTILGDGNLKNDLVDRIRKTGLSQSISLLGYIENPFPYYYHADRFVLSSRYEGMPNVVLEALALGTSVIALDNPGCIRDVIRKSKQGVLVSPCTAEALAHEMANQCSVYHTKRSENLLPDVFMIDNVINEYVKVFTSA